MSLALGIDTGGTYTDAVIIDYETGRVIAAAKSLTTKHDLALGITRAIDGVTLDPHEIGLVSLSTTLATNALVEGQGAPVGAILIGYDGHIAPDTDLSAALNTPYVALVAGGHDSSGRELAPLDIASAEQAVRAFDGEVAAFAVSGFFGARNPEHELAVRDLVRRLTHKPVTCGHELSSRLDALRRATTVALNASLIPLVCNLLDAVTTALAERGISAPLMVVKGDGSLISAEVARERPVETILSGPAASVVGALTLGGQRDGVVVDMGGTTTDIALIRDGAAVRAENGIRIGSWRTFVKGVYVETLGLGGDSAVRHDKNGNFCLESSRVMPLAAAASRWPQITEKLRALLAEREKHSFPLHEFFTLARPIGDGARYEGWEKRFCDALADGPLLYSEAAAALGRDVYSLDVRRLEREGVVLRAGLTPTDVMHLVGDFEAFDPEAARLGARFVAGSMGMNVEALCDRVYDSVKRRLYLSVAGMLIKENMPAFHKSGLGGELTALLSRAWEMAKGENARRVRFSLTTGSALIGVGAPVHIFLPDVAKALGARCEIPALAGVANALGAVAGNVAAGCSVAIRPGLVSGFTVYGPERSEKAGDLDEATEIARALAEREARAEAIRRGAAGDLVVRVEVNPVVTRSGYGSDVFLESAVTATAVGRIGPGSLREARTDAGSQC